VRDAEDLAGIQLDTSPEVRLRFSRDAWPRLRKLDQLGRDAPVVSAVACPRSVEEVARILRGAGASRRPIIPVGLRSNVVGGILPRGDEIALDLSGLDQIEAVDERALTVRAQAGVRGSELEEHLAARGLTLGHYPQSLALSSVGGWIATASSGIASTLYGSIERHLLGLVVALADGTLIEIPSWPRAAVGPALAQIFVGSEGTLGVVCTATLSVRRTPERRILESFALPSFQIGLELTREIIQTGITPAVLRLYNRAEATRFLAEDVGSLLIVVHEGPAEIVRAEHRRVRAECEASKGRSLGSEAATRWWDHRFDPGRLFTYAEHPNRVADAVEVAASWSRLARLSTRLEQELGPLAAEFHMHVSHLYPSGASLYLILYLDDTSPKAVLAKYDRAWATAMSICLEERAALSHHHGVGLTRLPYLAQTLGSGAELLRRLKTGLDPNGILNPGKLAPTDNSERHAAWT
jgi:alkyldihydroxyacetonephosphate synthase